MYGGNIVNKISTGLSVSMVLLLGLTACGASDGSIGDTAAPSATSSASAVTAPAETTTPEPEVSTSPAAAPAVEGIHAPSNGKIINTERGSYLQSTLADDDSALTYDPAIIDPSATGFFTPDEIAEGVKFILTFLAEEDLDSELNGGFKEERTAMVEQWWAEHNQLLAPEYHVEFKETITTEPFSLLVGSGGGSTEETNQVNTEDLEEYTYPE